MAALMSSPLMGDPFRLVVVPGGLGVATGGITFAGTAQTGSFSRIHATGGITFSGVGTRSARQVIFSTGGFVFGGHPLLVAAGRPLVVRAMPENFTVQAITGSYSVTAVPFEYVIRGVAHE
jgi:hypothetical protein